MAEEDKKPNDQSAHINLKVKGQDGNEVFFRIKKNTQLKKLMNAYCDRQSVDFNAIAFLFDGRRLRAEQTPDELEMEDGDEIDAMLHQTGGALPCLKSLMGFCQVWSNRMIMKPGSLSLYFDPLTKVHYNVLEEPPLMCYGLERELRTMAEEDKKPNDQSAHINLKVKGQDGNEVFFRIKKNTQLKKLMNAYCDQQSVDFNAIAFLFDGRRLRAEQTPDELEMEDGDEIDAMLHQTGGALWT
ncbi:hypothetical protein Ahy_A07g031648 [Arachis hypogaea]|uniref:Ubiquitin-like domain-containing protein n=4 Tax=Arachis TaxID=3817 RepID=A0A445C4N3_ARAHY|nr:hypothetical protein Ahy_A07g031648 [Arachis hypogaea]